MAYCKNTEIFITEANKIHFNRYDYTLVEYVHHKKHVKIICREHGIFEQTPVKHLLGRGCQKCGRSRILSTEEFIKRSKEVHGDKYNYSKTNYVNAKTLVIITCLKHGDFKQRPHVHMKGHSCPNCSIEYLSKLNQKNPTGWGVTSWNTSSKRSEKFDSFKVYVLKCWNDTEEFFKIGRTFKKVVDRFNSQRRMPYKFNIIMEMVYSTAEEAFRKEKELKILHKDFKYTPNIKFCGSSECYYNFNDGVV